MNSPAEPSNSSTQQSVIDIEKLTEKVYQLLRADLRLARKRGGKNLVRK